MVKMSQAWAPSDQNWTSWKLIVVNTRSHCTLDYLDRSGLNKVSDLNETIKRTRVENEVRSEPSDVAHESSIEPITCEVTNSWVTWSHKLKHCHQWIEPVIIDERTRWPSSLIIVQAWSRVQTLFTLLESRLEMRTISNLSTSVRSIRGILRRIVRSDLMNRS